MNDKKIHTEQSIIGVLERKYSDNSKYYLSNVYVFKYNWESDFFILRQNGYCIEFEIKISRADFFNDKKKVDKHLILENGKCVVEKSKQIFNEDKFRKIEYIKYQEEQIHDFRPNKFYYVVPENLIKLDEIPKYAGLLYIDDLNQIIIVKEAPFLHKNKLNFNDKFVDKFYYYFQDFKQKFRNAEKRIKYLEDKFLK